MMNFRKRVAKSGKRTSCFHGLSWQQRKQYKSNTDKKYFERPSDAYVSAVKISFKLTLDTPAGSRCGSKKPWPGEG